MLNLGYHIGSQEQLRVLYLRQSISWYYTLQNCWYVTLHRVLKPVGHDRAHHGHTHCRTNRAEEGEAGCDFSKLPIGEGILNNDREEAHHHTNAKTGNKHVADDLALTCTGRHQREEEHTDC